MHEVRPLGARYPASALPGLSPELRERMLAKLAMIGADEGQGASAMLRKLKWNGLSPVVLLF